MLLKIEIDAIGAVEALDGVGATVTSEGLANAAGAFAIDRILKRTRSGKDVNDNLFAPYSSAYRRKKGGTVNLSNSGAMLESLGYQANSSIEATVTCSSEIAQYHEDGTTKMPQRQFVGLSEKDKEDMIEEIFVRPLKNLIS